MPGLVSCILKHTSHRLLERLTFIYDEIVRGTPLRILSSILKFSFAISKYNLLFQT